MFIAHDAISLRFLNKSASLYVPCSFVEVWLDTLLADYGWDLVAFDAFCRSRVASAKLLSIRQELERGRGERGEGEPGGRKRGG